MIVGREGLHDSQINSKVFQPTSVFVQWWQQRSPTSSCTPSCLAGSLPNCYATAVHTVVWFNRQLLSASVCMCTARAIRQPAVCTVLCSNNFFQPVPECAQWGPLDSLFWAYTALLKLLLSACACEAHKTACCQHTLVCSNNFCQPRSTLGQSPWWKITIMRDRPDGRPPSWWESTLIKDQLRPPPWW